MMPVMRDVLKVESWDTHCSHYAEREVGDYRLKKTSYAPGMYRLYRVDGFSYFQVTKEIPVMSLEGRENGEWRQWMIDDPFNYLAMRRYCERMSGRVLTSGLGLGIAATALAENPKVSEVVIVERAQEVIDLIAPYLPKGKLRIVHDDFWTYVKRHPRRSLLHPLAPQKPFGRSQLFLGPDLGIRAFIDTPY